MYSSLRPLNLYNLPEESNVEKLTKESKIIELTEAVKEMALTLGAFKVGIAMTETCQEDRLLQI